MKIPRIAKAIGNIDDDLIANAENNSKPKNKLVWVKWASLAACLVIFVVVGALFIPMLRGAKSADPEADADYMEDIKYNGTIIGSESGIIFPWDYMLPNEKYTMVKYDGQEYQSRGREISAELLENIIGDCTAKGFDVYTDKLYSEKFDVIKIKGISEKRLIAVSMDGKYYVYFNDKSKCPATFGELITMYDLSKTLSLVKFSINEGYKEKGYYQIADDSYIWQILLECQDAELYAEAEKWNRGDRNYLSFTATSEALGVYKKVFYITEDGYVSTNIFNYQCVYYIGVEKANRVIEYAKNNANEAEREQYEYTIAGTITGIGDGYILIDDTVLCKDKKDGMVFKVLTDELIIRRYLECTNIMVGDTVAVKFQTKIVLGEDNTVSGAISMYKGKVTDSGMAVPE